MNTAPHAATAQDRPSSPGPVLAALGAIAALLTLLFPSPPRQEGPAAAVFEVTIRASRVGAAQLFCDLGGGFTERTSSRLDVAPGTARHTFALSAGRIEALRFDPSDHDAPVSLSAAQIVDRGTGAVLHRFAPGDFVAAQQIQSLAVQGPELVVTTPPGANDAALHLKLPRALVLPAADTPELRARDAHHRATQRTLALVLVFVGVPLWSPWLRRLDRRLATAVGLGYAVLCVLYSRRPDAIAWPQFWAEDGTVFFAQQAAQGWSALWTTHGGYLHLIPRATAGLASLAPVAWAPTVYLAVALAVVLAAAIKAASPRVGLPFPCAAALAVVLVPNMEEIAFNLTNAQWFGAVALLLVALSRAPGTRAELARDVGLVTVFGLSGPFAVFFLPLFVWRAWCHRSGGTWATAAVALAAAAVQLLAYRASPPPPALGGEWQLAQAVAGIGYRTGCQLLNVLPLPVGRDLAALGLAGALGWLALWVALPVPPAFRPMRWALFYAALVVLAGATLRYQGLLEFFYQRVHLQRYLHLPLVATAWLLLAGLATEGVRRGLAAVLLAAVVWRNVGWYRMAPLTDYDWPGYAARIERREATEVPINPPGWTFPHRPAAKERPNVRLRRLPSSAR